MSEENRDNFKTYIVKEKDFTDLIIKDKEDNYYYSAMYVNELQQEIERLNNIIKEVIEYIKDRYDGEVLTHTFDKCNVGELLEILDKVGDEK